jgi:hypothetical protein
MRIRRPILTVGESFGDGWLVQKDSIYMVDEKVPVILGNDSVMKLGDASDLEYTNGRVTVLLDLLRDFDYFMDARFYQIDAVLKAEILIGKTIVKAKLVAVSFNPIPALHPASDLVRTSNKDDWTFEE